VSKKLDIKEFIEKAKKIHGDKYDYSKVNYTNSKTKICIICPKHGDFFQCPNKHLSGQGCPVCGKIDSNKKRIILSTQEFVNQANLIHEHKYLYLNTHYKGRHKKIKYLCCRHGEIEQEANSHLKGKGCPFCGQLNLGNYKKLNKRIFEKRSNLIHNSEYDYSQVKYLNSSIKVLIKHKKCGKYFFQLPSHHLNGVGCPYCKKSRLEKKVENILIKFNIKYENGYRKFKWLKYKSYLELDFYLPEYNIAIECQGRQHFENEDFFGGKSEYKKIKKRDNIKKKLCEQHNLPLYYVNYDDNVEEKMGKILLFKNKVLSL